MNLKRIIALTLCATGICAFGATELQEALDCTDLEFTTGGNSGWTAQSDVVHTGTSALQSGWIDDDGQTYVETTVTGAGSLEFQWKVSSERNYDVLSVWVDGEPVKRISGEQDWSAMSVAVSGDGEHTVRWVYEKDVSAYNGSDCAWLDAVKWTPAPEKMTMKFVLNGGKGATSGDFRPGDTYGDLPKPTKSGADFLRWCRNSDCSDLHAESESLPYENTTFYAKWGWSLSRIAAGGLTVSSLNPEWTCEKCEDGAFAAFCALAGSGSSAKPYELAVDAFGAGTLSFDWFKDSGASADIRITSWSFDGYEEWQRTVKFVNGPYGQWNHYELRAVDVSRIVWTVTSYGTVIGYNENNRIGIANVKWTPAPEEIFVEFETNGGSACEPAIYGAETCGRDLPVPEREGFVFLGWYHESTFKTRISESEFIPFEPRLTLYAKWALPLSRLNHDGMVFDEIQDGWNARCWFADAVPGAEGELAAFYDVTGGSGTELQLSGLSGAGMLSFDLWSDGYVGLQMRYGTLNEYEDEDNDYSEFVPRSEMTCTIESWEGGRRHFEVPLNMAGNFVVRWRLWNRGEGLTRVCVANVKWTPAPEKISVICDVPGGDPITVGEFAPGATFGEIPPPVREGYAFVGWIDPNEQGINPLTGEPLIRLFDKSEMLPFREEVRVKALWGLPLEGFDTKDLEFVNDGDFPWFVAEGVKGESGGPVARALACGSTEDITCLRDDCNVARLMTQANGYGTLTFKYRTAAPVEIMTTAGVLTSIRYYQQDFSCEVDGAAVWSDNSIMPFDETGKALWLTGQVVVHSAGEHVICWKLFNDSVLAGCAELCDVVWTPAPASMSVSFDSDGGSPVDPLVVEPGDPYGELPVPEREGWEFLGWYERTATGALPGPVVEPGQPVPFSDVTLVAKWGCPVSGMTDAGLKFTTAGTDQFRLTSVRTPGGNCAAEAQPTSDSNPEWSGFGLSTDYVNPTLNTTVKGPGYLSFKYAVGAEVSESGFSVGGFLTTFRVSVDGKVVHEDTLPDPGSWQNVNLALEGASTKVHKISIEVGGSGIVSCFVGDFTFEKSGPQESLEAWVGKVTNYKVWTKGDLARFAGEYAKRIAADTADYEARIFHAATILANLAENKDFQSYAKTFGYTLDYAHCAFTGTLKLDSKTAQVNTMVDKAIKVALPVMQQAIEDLEGIPDDWTGTVKLSAENWPVDEDVDLDFADVLFAKASLQGGIGVLQLLGGYDLTVDWPKAKAELAYDPTKAVAAVASLPGVNDDAEWLRVTPIAGDGEVVKEVRLVKCGERLAVLMEAAEDRTFDDLAAASFDLKSAKGKLSLSQMFIEGLAQSSSVFGTIDDEFVYGEIPVTCDASREGFLHLTFDLQGKNVALASTAWKFAIGQASVLDGQDWLVSKWEYSPVSARWQKAIQEQTKFFSKVRNSTRVQNAKDWVRNALQTALDADKAVLARTDDRLHFVEYDDFDAERVDVARKNTEKALEALDSDGVKFDLAELFANGHIAENYDFTLLPGGGNMLVYLGALFTGEITRAYMPFTYLDEYGLLCIDCYSMKDPTFAGLSPEMTVDYWAGFLGQPGHPEDHPVQETPFVPGEKVSLTCSRLIGYSASGLPKGWKWDSKKGLLTGTAAEKAFTITFKSGSRKEDVKFEIAPLPKLSVVMDPETIAEYGEGVIVVGGAGGFKANATAKAKAEVAAGFAFVGWFDEKGELVSKDKIYSFKMPVVDVTLTAKAIALADDGLTFEEVRSEIVLAKGERVDTGAGAYFRIASGSAYTVSASGLPSGVSLVKLAASSYALSGAPKKAGVFYATLNAKNNGGFKNSCVIRFVVGGAKETETNTANIDLAGVADAHPRTGFLFEYSADVPNSVKNGAVKKITVSGLPKGWTAKATVKASSGCSYCDVSTGVSSIRISGRAKTAGAYTLKVTVTYKNKKTAVAIKKIIVFDSGSAYFSVQAASGQSGRGSVSGGGVYAIGSQVKVKATPAGKNKYFFAGWYRDENCQERCTSLSADGEWRKASVTVPFDSDWGEGGLYARFVTKDEDEISIVCDDEWHVEPTCGTDPLVISVESVTLPTLKATTLPSGIKLSGGKLVVSKASSLKPGKQKVVLTAKNQSGNSVSKTVWVVVPNLTQAVDYGCLDLDTTDEGYCQPVYGDNFRAGMKVSFSLADIGIWVAAGWKLSVSGLPSGWTYKNGMISGTATAVGPKTVTFKVTKGSKSYKATATFDLSPLPDWAVGTFVGATEVRFLNGAGTYGPMKMTVDATGKVSGSYMMLGPGTKTSFSGTGFTWDEAECALVAKVSAKVGGVKRTFAVRLNEEGATFEAEWIIRDGGMDGVIASSLLTKNPWSGPSVDKSTLPKFAQEISHSFPWEGGWYEGQEGTLTLTFGTKDDGSVSAKFTTKKGTVSATLQLADFSGGRSENHWAGWLIVGIPANTSKKIASAYCFVPFEMKAGGDGLVHEVVISNEEIMPYLPPYS